ncbi:hypothetical protein G7Z17_g273 [Cylindrodendrum hubeiense]|uniref:Cyanovirin-N domain-containing protein n=1 Tax=Cylindrodendrum hubeiense TaxID=595255 RepID=A0A9P5HNJ9_9HYPO|nr:hypothetical protein G7Z17_g273 [Cylindrodendrum hubeiense]
MSFHHSAEDISLEDGHILVAKLGNGDGDMVDATFDLNYYIGNDNGSFQWGGENFSESSEDISFSLEGDDNSPILRATLHNVDGEGIERDLNLAERISNSNGEFIFLA